MSEIWRSKFIIGTLLTTIMVVLSYEVKQTFIKTSPIILVILSFIISTYLANVLVSIALGSKLGRKLIMRKTWIEGYWYLSTADTPEYPNNISQAGITYISYEGDQYILRVITYRKVTDKMHTGLPSLSDLVTIRSFDLKFSNIFSISDGKSETKGVTIGEFFCDGTVVYPNRYEGHVVLYNEGKNRRQSGTKIPDKDVSKLMKEHNDCWMDVYLNKRHEIK
jgi:hypothetical protein